MGHENMDGEDDHEYYDVKDFNIGVELNINNRTMQIVNCNKFTREHYKKGAENGLLPSLKNDIMSLKELIDPTPEKKIKRPFPPHNGFGSEEDSIGNCKKLIIKPYRKDELKLVVMEGKTLKFSCKMVNSRPADQGRREFLSLVFFVCLFLFLYRIEC